MERCARQENGLLLENTGVPRTCHQGSESQGRVAISRM